ncbi:MAG: Cas9 inhibitor AcrIIA9 family protein [Clostridiaceae bacterium]|nr:Cas9 inhibitor AcrIIA9 family protein [Clostridiaceae bacterium]
MIYVIKLMKEWHDASCFASCHSYFGKENKMGVFSEMNMEMSQWELETPPSAGEIQPFNLEPPAEEAVPGQDAFDDDAAQQAEADNAPATLAHLMGQPEPEEEKAEEDANCQEEESGEEAQKNADQESAEEAQKRAEHEAAEAKRKAEWESKQQVKKNAEQAALQKLASMGDDEVMMASMQRIGDDSERLTRRNMKVCVTEHIQTLCLNDSAFARMAMHPRKSMIHCFYYINRKAREYIEQEMKDNDVKPDNGVYGGDVPDDLCYQWSEDYFRDPNAPEDQEQEEKFVPKPYSGKYTPKAKSKKNTEKKKPEKKPEKKEVDDGQLSFSSQMSLLDLGETQKAS